MKLDLGRGVRVRRPLVCGWQARGGGAERRKGGTNGAF